MKMPSGNCIVPTIRNDASEVANVALSYSEQRRKVEKIRKNAEFM